MFTGIIQAVGKVREPEKLGDGVRLTIVAPKEFHLDEVKVGDSIACNGACMTVTGINGDEFNVDVSAESLSKTWDSTLSVTSTWKRRCGWATAWTATW